MSKIRNWWSCNHRLRMTRIPLLGSYGKQGGLGLDQQAREGQTSASLPGGTDVPVVARKSF